MTTLPLSITNPNEIATATEVATAPAASITLVASTTISASSESSSVQSPASAPAQQATLTPAEIAGVTISGVAAAVIVFFLVGWLVSCCRRRKRQKTEQHDDHRANSRFGASDKEVVPDVERGQDRRFHPPYQTDIARAYPTIGDPEKIGVAVSSPSQTDVTPSSAQTATPWTNQGPVSPSQLHVSPPQNVNDYRRADNNARNDWRHSITPVSPPSAYSEHFSPVLPAELPTPTLTRVPPAELPAGPSSRPPPLTISKPAPVAVGPRSTNNIRIAPRESRQSVHTIINDEPMSPPARGSILKIAPQAIHAIPQVGPRLYTQTRDYIPSYYMQDSEPAQLASPPVPTPSVPPGTVQREPRGPRTKRASPLSPPVSRFSRPLPSHQDSPTIGFERAVASTSKSPRPTPQTPPSAQSQPSALSKLKTPPKGQYGLPLNPRPIHRASPSPSQQPVVYTDKEIEPKVKANSATSPPTSWKHLTEWIHDHQPKTPLPSMKSSNSPKVTHRPPPPPTRRTSQKSKAESVASMTSFETSEDEIDATPPEQQLKQSKQLSPLPEVSGERSPISTLRYPKVPRPANQSAVRRNGSPTRAGRDEHTSRPLKKSASSNSLLEKRKGSDAASDLQKALWITGSNGSTSAAATKVRELPVRVDSRRQPPSSTAYRSRTPEMQMKSPLWEPKLTPRRDSSGGLVIEVS